MLAAAAAERLDSEEATAEAQMTRSACVEAADGGGGGRDVTERVNDVSIESLAEETADEAADETVDEPFVADAVEVVVGTGT